MSRWLFKPRHNFVDTTGIAAASYLIAQSMYWQAAVVFVLFVVVSAVGEVEIYDR